ncbi:MAG: hypothetical protein HYR62_09470 [Actinobacteria bacterium]|nr:hypothetical protein [Actinomycetota bacterium]MBI3688017.1 hypothetical protein [Actinomycetota bacterium]
MTTYSTPRSGALTTAGALAVESVMALAGGGVDLLTGPGLRRGFAVGLVLGAAVAALLVRRKDAFMAIVAPPLLYLLVQMLFAAGTGTLSGSTTQLAALLSNWLVNGFPEMVAATGLALVITLARMIARR